MSTSFDVRRNRAIARRLLLSPGDLQMVAYSTPYSAKGLIKDAIHRENLIVHLEHILLHNIKEWIPDEEHVLRMRGRYL
ncbi:hypothetical protein KSP40_PGU012037 [Platanthera guangdongensis]|uniref:Uncharacterized protein n=1 Tax=Platanthera guangdongensis TaxID=2320717 RepID=A0ABR2LLA7_9ASPA